MPCSTGFTQVAVGEQQRECSAKAVTADKDTTFSCDNDVVDGTDDLRVDGIQCCLKAGVHLAGTVLAANA